VIEEWLSEALRTDGRMPALPPESFVIKQENTSKENEMKFLSIYKTVERYTPPSPEEMAAMGKLIDEGMKAGWLVATEGCLPSALGARVRRDRSKISVTDGPFTESKEVVGGFAILKADSKEEAIELAKDFLKVAGEGECEIRQIYEPGDAPCVNHGEREVALKA
jgi:hypothetical protein